MSYIYFINFLNDDGASRCKIQINDTVMTSIYIEIIGFCKVTLNCFNLGLIFKLKQYYSTDTI